MERRIGTVLIYVENREAAPQVNAVLSRHAGIIICRQGFPREHYSIISVIFEGTTDEIGSLTGQLGRIEDIEVKSALLKGRETSRRETTIKVLRPQSYVLRQSIILNNNLKIKQICNFIRKNVASLTSRTARLSLRKRFGITSTTPKAPLNVCMKSSKSHWTRTV